MRPIVSSIPATRTYDHLSARAIRILSIMSAATPERRMNLRDAIQAEGPIKDATPDIEVWPESIPLRERLLDRMGNLLFCAEDLLDMIECDDNHHRFQQWEQPIRIAFDEINSLMNRLCD